MSASEILARISREVKTEPNQALDTLRSYGLRSALWGAVLGFGAGFVIAAATYLITLYLV